MSLNVFGGEFHTFQKMKDAPDGEKLSEEEQKRIMHVALPIRGGAVLMGSDTLPSMGHVLNKGNDINICLQPDNKAEADKLFEKLSEGGNIEMPMNEEFWGDCFGSLIDKFGLNWLIFYPLARTELKTPNQLCKLNH